MKSKIIYGLCCLKISIEISRKFHKQSMGFFRSLCILKKDFFNRELVMPSVFVHFLIIMATLGIMVLIDHKWRINMALGCLLGGFFLGPLGFHFISKTTMLDSFFHICLMMFLGIVGLEIPLHRLKVFLRPIVTQGIPQVILSSLVLLPIIKLLAPSLSLGWCWVVSLSFSFSSTALVLHLLQDREELTTTLGRQALSLLFAQDIGAILLLTVVGFLVISGNSDTQSQPLNLLSFGIIFGKILSGLLMILGTNFFIKRHWNLFSSKESLFLLGILVILWGSYMGHITHFSAEIGAFLGGMILASSPLRHGIMHTLEPLRPLCVGIFFISIGLELTRWPSGGNFLVIVVGTALFMILKILTIWFLTRRKNPAFSLLLGCLMASGSEFVFMILPLCRQYIDPGTLNTLFFMAFISLLATPFLYNGMRKFLNVLGDDMGDHHKEDSSMMNYDDMVPVVVAGFGSTGEGLCKFLVHQNIPFVVVDHCQESLEYLFSKGYLGCFGDIRDLECLESLGFNHGGIFLVTFGHLDFIPQWIRCFKLRFPYVNICVQVKTYEEAESLSSLNIHIVLENAEEHPGESLAYVALHSLGFSWEKVSLPKEGHHCS